MFSFTGGIRNCIIILLNRFLKEMLILIFVQMKNWILCLMKYTSTRLSFLIQVYLGSFFIQWCEKTPKNLPLSVLFFFFSCFFSHYLFVQFILTVWVKHFIFQFLPFIFLLHCYYFLNSPNKIKHVPMCKVSENCIGIMHNYGGDKRTKLWKYHETNKIMTTLIVLEMYGLRATLLGRKLDITKKCF